MQFAAVVGQTELKKHLVTEVKNEKISHAQLFLGKAGFGSLPLALAFIQYVLCENRGEEDSCGECNACRKMMRLQHPDVHFAFPVVQAISKVSDSLLPDWRAQILEQPYFDLNSWIQRIDSKERKPIIGKEESQEIIRKLSLRSYEGGYKIMLVWMAEEMNPTCANKLLKIIEEPPEKTLIILVASAQEYMLQTILSRTQKVVVPRVDMDSISSWLRSAHRLSADSADSIASRCDGDLLEAISVASESADQAVFHEQFVQLMRVCYKKNVLDMMSWAEQISGASKEQQKQFLRYGLHMLRQSMLRNYTEDQLTRVSASEDSFLQNFARFITGNNILDFNQLFNNSVYHIDRNANSKILFTNFCFQVMRFIHVA
ncbi:MAG: hypothetical protein A3D92_04605 [Bacteroidetes bacterium RIFCSPHIGHO2_02_FULL_44_7]|nr:MAG: hypothetical protein A3D92_04605 [Bacteroidetes bacterium RIFCSPHIGHO2_02_FULL_44_7]